MLHCRSCRQAPPVTRKRRRAPSSQVKDWPRSVRLSRVCHTASAKHDDASKNVISASRSASDVQFRTQVVARRPMSSGGMQIFVKHEDMQIFVNRGGMQIFVTR